MSSQDKFQRSILPIPDVAHVGLTTDDAKDPDMKFPPIEALRPPNGAPSMLVILKLQLIDHLTAHDPLILKFFQKLSVLTVSTAASPE